MPSDPKVWAALRASTLGALPDDVLSALASEAMPLEVPAGSNLIREGESWTGLLLVVSGLVKTFLTSPDGRQITIRYAHHGSLVGAASLFHAPPNPAGSRAVSAARVLVFNAASVRRMADADARVASALGTEMAARLYEYFGELGGTAFSTSRQRVVRHLLDIASHQPGATLIVRLSHQELADAVGTVREVVSRILAKLRDEGLLRSGSGEIEILDPARLHECVWSSDKHHAPADRSR